MTAMSIGTGGTGDRCALAPAAANPGAMQDLQRALEGSPVQNLTRPLIDAAGRPMSAVFTIVAHQAAPGFPCRLALIPLSD